MAHPSLAERIPASGRPDPAEILDRFLAWVGDVGLDPYPAQEDALLELAGERHVVLETPTGSGKSLVALGLHFKALCEGRRSFYTAPIKALVNEKFFRLCEDFGAERVGMLTGDASINRQAPILCCTAEVLSNMALREGEFLDAPYVVMDEFHYYGDRDRGTAWQVPLLVFRNTLFLLMSATLGDTSAIARRIRSLTGRDVATVRSDERPVPLDYEYRETPIHETIEALLAQGRAPVYLVNFTQRECAERAQGLTSAKITTREERQRLGEILADFRFDTPYGSDVRRFIRHGIGIHHAGLLPKYRLLVEQLSQQGLLKVICGTDTLGMGVNIPIRTVVFARLCKYDGEKVGILSARDFRQISGRAGRKGFDERGSIVCQAPEHVIENRKLAAAGDRKKPRRKPPRHGFVPWNRDTFEKLIARPPETLVPQFAVTHGMLINVMQRPGAAETRSCGYRDVIELIERSHQDEGSRPRLRREAAVRFRSLRRAGVVKRSYDVETGTYRLRVAEDLQWDFSLHQTLSLYLVEAIRVLHASDPGYALDVLTLVEAILENPDLVLRQQAAKLRQELVARLKAARVPYEERMEKLDAVTHPKPDADFIYSTFDLFASSHPWVGVENIRPKSIAREMFEDYLGFDDYVRRYGLQRAEGLLLRYLGQVYHTLCQSVPEPAKTDAVHDAVAFFRSMLERVDSSLLEEWQSLLAPEEGEAVESADRRAETAPAPTPRALAARIRAECHRLARSLAQRDFEEAARCVRQDSDDPWDAARFEVSLAAFFAEYERIVFEPRARQAEYTLIRPAARGSWEVFHTLLDPRDDNLWCLEATLDLDGGETWEGPLLQMRRIGS